MRNTQLCSFHQEGICKLGLKCALKHAEEDGREPQKRKNSVVVAKTLGRTQAEDKITSLKFIEKGDFLHGVTGIPVIFQQTGKNVVSKFRLSRVAQRFVRKREKKGPNLGELHKKC